MTVGVPAPSAPAGRGDNVMCRAIKTLANFEPPATDEEIRASALQFVRKLSGTARPSRANEAVFNQAVEDVTAVAQRLVRSLVTPRPREPGGGSAQSAGSRSRPLRLTAGAAVASLETAPAQPPGPSVMTKAIRSPTLRWRSSSTS